MTKQELIRSIKSSIEYRAISDFYADRRANRSQVLLMNHIDEGVVIIFKLMEIEKATPAQAVMAARAYCLHPLLQNDNELATVGAHYADRLYAQAFPVMLAMEYRARANEWLSDKVVDDSSYSYNEDNTKRRVVERYKLIGKPTPGVLREVRMMLVADKVQNYKDFITHHRGTHARSAELDLYFKAWLDALGISQAGFAELRETIQQARREGLLHG